MSENKATKRTCLTCSVKGNTHKVSKWMKKEGVYSSLPKCLSCEDKYNPNVQTLKIETPKIKGCALKVELKIKEKDSWVFYWASEPTPFDELEPIKDAPEAYNGYGNEDNRGLVKTDGKGDVVLTLNCPTVYKDEGKLFPRHVHYSVLKSDNTWTEKIGTLEVICRLPYDDMKEVVKLKNRVVINALPKSDYEKKHIPGSLNLYYKTLEDMSKNRMKTAVNKVIKDGYDEYPDIKKFLADSKNRSTDVPIIVYCAHEKCDASDKLVEMLYSCGFMDVLLYPGGTKEWFENTDDDTFFDDADSDDTDDSSDSDDSDNSDKDIRLDDDAEEDDEETIVYDSVKYLHNLESDEIMTDDGDVVGEYDGEDIVWYNSKFYKDHLKRKKAMKDDVKDDVKDDKGELEKEDKEELEKEDEETDKKDDLDEDKKIVVVKKDEEDSEQDGEEEEGEEELKEIDIEKMSEEDETSSSEEESDDEDYQSQSVKELKEILKQMNLNTKGRKADLVNRIKECQPIEQNGGYNGYNNKLHKDDSIFYGGGLRLSSQFRGWGFSFYR